jgi:hypothetical protein
LLLRVPRGARSCSSEGSNWSKERRISTDDAHLKDIELMQISLSTIWLGVAGWMRQEREIKNSSL